MLEGVGNDVRDMMIRALKGSLDFVMNDIHPEGDKTPDFMSQLPMFQDSVGQMLFKDLSELDFLIGADGTPNL
jgi:hypothetical protein